MLYAGFRVQGSGFESLGFKVQEFGLHGHLNAQVLQSIW